MLCLVETGSWMSNWTENLPGLNHIGSLPSSFASTNPVSTVNQKLESVFEQYSELFQPQLGCFTEKPVVLNESKEPNFTKPDQFRMLCSQKWRTHC